MTSDLPTRTITDSGLAEAGAQRKDVPGDCVRILIVDDERFFREAIGDILTDANFECEAVESGEEALERASDPSIGVLVLDIRLPGIDGIEVLRRVRALRRGLRVIMLSAHTDQELVLDALRLGACDYLAKPLHDEELVLSVRRAVEGFAVAERWTRLRSRLDSLACHLQSLANRAEVCVPSKRDEVLHGGATAAAAELLEATKVSLMLLDESGDELTVVSTVGRSIDVAEMDRVAVGDGIAGVAFEGSEPLLVDRVGSDQRFALRAQPERYHSDSFVIAPLEPGRRRLGVLCVADRAGGAAFGEDDAAILRLLALQVAVMLSVEKVDESGEDPDSGDTTRVFVAPGESQSWQDESADPGDALAARDAELARLVCDAIVSEVEPERLLAAALAPIARELPAAPVSLYLLDAATGELRLECECDGGSRSDRESLPPGRGLGGCVLESGHLVASPEPAADPRFDAEIDTPCDGRAGPLLCLPIVLRGKVVGLFRAFLEEGAPVLPRTGEVLVSALSAAVRNVLLYRSLVESIDEVADARSARAPRS